MKELKYKFVIPESRKNRLQVLSSGGGTQSNCMIVLIALGALPKPDLVVMADTGREMSSVFEYQKTYIKPICDSIGLEYKIIKKSDWTSSDLSYSDDSPVPLPGFFIIPEGENNIQKLPSYCSKIWKTEPIMKYLNNRYGQNELTKKGVDFWIGMSFDEPKRIKTPIGKWQKRYPLFEARIIREQAIQIVKEFGLPEPPRSACWMCPNRPVSDYIEMKYSSPNDYEKACKFEKEELQQFEQQMFLTKEGKYISEISENDIDKQNQIDALEKFCDTGMCFV